MSIYKQKDIRSTSTCLYVAVKNVITNSGEDVTIVLIERLRFSDRKRRYVLAEAAG